MVERQRLSRFSRLHRLRSAQRLEALQQLAVARSETRRLEDLAVRSRALIEDYAARRRTTCAHELQLLHRLGSELAKLAGSVEQMGARAEQVERSASDRLVIAERRLEQTGQRVDALRQARDNRREREMAAPALKLARKLQREQQSFRHAPRRDLTGGPDSPLRPINREESRPASKESKQP